MTVRRVEKRLRFFKLVVHSQMRKKKLPVFLKALI
jgi:hypothetical protein